MNWNTVRDNQGRTCEPQSFNHDDNTVTYRVAGSFLHQTVPLSTWEHWAKRGELANERAGMADDEHHGAD